LLYPDQGLGDTIQFLRYAPLIQARGGIVLFDCQPGMARLFSRIPGVDRVLPTAEPQATFDVQAALSSLPRIFETTLQTIPNVVPYLRADANLVEYWRKELAPLGGFKIGIAWQGNPNHHWDRYRSVPLSHFESLAKVEGVKLVSLQKGAGAEQLHAGQIANLPEAAERLSILDLKDRLDKTDAFVDTAAILMNLDLVITVDTALAHLAGALGVPVWVALAITPDWRWLLEREDSPWYPTLRLFRQRRFGEWDEVFERMASEIHQVPLGSQRHPHN
jgi:ADP-heptose:LPS heptosyltransferase